MIKNTLFSVIGAVVSVGVVTYLVDKVATGENPYANKDLLSKEIIDKMFDKCQDKTK